jgi:D-alanyl-D-alanine carboxypeptidase
MALKYVKHKNLKKCTGIALSIFYICLLLFPIQKVYAKPIKPSVAADGAVLMDSETGEILYSKNMNRAYPPASTTKVMTALLALENCKLEDKVIIGKNPPKTDGNNIALFEGEELTVKDMMYALVNESANDCANALAEHISGSVEEFAKKMNEKALELGCKSTNFINPSGLYNSKHKTSAKDLATIMRALIKHKEYTDMATTVSYTIPSTNKTQKERIINNHNRLIQKNSGFYYQWCEGGKTGYTIQSEHSFVACANKYNHKLIVALVHDAQKNFYRDCINLFDYGFTQKTWKEF